MDEDSMKLPTGKCCGMCAHWKRCKALISTLNRFSMTCDFAPSRFVDSKPEPTHSADNGGSK